MNDSAAAPKWPADTAARIAAARERGASFQTIAADFGVSFAALRNKAIALGVHTAVPRRLFTPEEDRIIRADYLAHVDIAVTAAKLGRSWGAVRQRIFHHMKDLLKQGRTTRSWRALRQYGPSMLDHGASPDEAALMVKELVTAVKARARAAALEAKARRRRERIDLMLEQIAGGRERDAAIFEARSLGAAFEDIGRAIGVTRERVRQICNDYAFKAATDQMLVDPAPTSAGQLGSRPAA
jgi:DNA-directed RNA polymerase sigma subunit (sigma70/sigma32)